jgi:uncharacterized protein
MPPILREDVMSTLTVPVASVPEEGLPIDSTLSEEDVRPEGAARLGLTTARVRGNLSRVDGHYIFLGTVSGVLSQPCDRCLCAAESPFDASVVWDFEPGPPLRPWEDAPGEAREDDEDDETGEDDERRTGRFSGDTLDMAPLAWEDLVLAAPSKLLCDDACAGLCPHCGANLNEGACGCVETTAPDGGNTGLKALGDLFPDLKPGTDKE